MCAEASRVGDPCGKATKGKIALGLVGGSVPFIRRLGGVDPEGIRGGGDVNGADGQKDTDSVGRAGDLALELFEELVGINDVVDACEFLG